MKACKRMKRKPKCMYKETISWTPFWPLCRAKIPINVCFSVDDVWHSGIFSPANKPSARIVGVHEIGFLPFSNRFSFSYRNEYWIHLIYMLLWHNEFISSIFWLCFGVLFQCCFVRPLIPVICRMKKITPKRDKLLFSRTGGTKQKLRKVQNKNHLTIQEISVSVINYSFYHF
jgi:hypothetical protein